MVLNSLLCALVVQRLPYQTKQVIIRARRESEEKEGETFGLEELLDLYNNLIHDLEISQGGQKEKLKPKKVEHGAEEPTKPKRRSLLVKKSKDYNKKNCVLCSSNKHDVHSHHFDRDGAFPIQEIRQVLLENALCLKCCGPIEPNSLCESADCAKVTRNCFHCSSQEHHSLLCPHVNK